MFTCGAVRRMRDVLLLAIHFPVTIAAIVEPKRRNPKIGCVRIAQQISQPHDGGNLSAQAGKGVSTMGAV